MFEDNSSNRNLWLNLKLIGTQKVCVKKNMQVLIILCKQEFNFFFLSTNKLGHRS